MEFSIKDQVAYSGSEQGHLCFIQRLQSTTEAFFSCAIFHITTAIFLIKGRVSDQLDVQSWLRKLILHWGPHFPVECKGSETPVSWNTNLRSTVCSFLVLFTIACHWAPPIEGLLRMACVSPCSPGYFAVPSGIGCKIAREWLLTSSFPTVFTWQD